MRSGSYRAFFLLLFIGFSSSGIASDPVDTEKLHHFFSALETENRFMGSVVLMKGDEILFSRAYGVSDQDGVPADEQSIYRIGSITKSYTAVMLLRLAEQGELSLDDSLSEWYPDMPNAGRITLRQMLNHSSGLTNFTNLPEYMEYHTSQMSREEMLEILREAGADFDPGEGQSYSNTAFVLLGYIIEDVTGMSYEQALREMITEPAGFTRTRFGSHIDREAGEVESFVRRDGSWEPSSETNMMIPHGAGAIAATAGETARFYKKLFSGKLISEESLAEMTDFSGPFGLGLIRFPFHDKTAIGHNGGIDGFQSNAAYFEEDDVTVAILGNGVNYNFNDILIGFLSISFGMEYEIPDLAEAEIIHLPEEELQAYAGDYASPGFPLELTLFVQHGQLMAQGTGQPAFELTLHDEHTMSFEQAGLTIEFEPKEGERFNVFILRQNNMEFEFSRKEEE
jgi:D-alanyl-D-alanine carboxypeptidase